MATPTPTPVSDDTTDTDAWFVAFAPAYDPQVAVAVMLVGQGAGGATAAPAARTVLEAAVRR
jgi:cell division protein FtsI/penicillin-binding protein 2